MANNFFTAILDRLKGGDIGGLGRGILAQVEPMSDPQRWRHMLELGRRARIDEAVRDQIYALAAATNFFPRRLAVMSSFGSGDADIIAAALTGPSLKLSSLAQQAAVAHFSEEQLAELAIRLPTRRRKHLLQRCAQKHLTGVIERVFDRLSRQEQLALVSCAGAAFVSAKLADPDFAEALGPNDWGRIARRYPVIAREALTSRLSRETEPPHHLIAAIRLAITRMAVISASDALALLESAAARAPIASLSYHVLAPLYPQRIAELLLADSAEATPSIPLAVLRKTHDETRLALLRLRGAGVYDYEFSRLAPIARKRLYDNGLIEAARNDAGALPAEFVAKLPRAARIDEAQRAWDAPKYAALPVMRLPYLAFMSFDEALSRGRAYSSQPDGDLRAAANAAIIGSGRYEPAQLPTILDFVLAKKNEQDPVRAAMIDALAKLPPTRWTPEHLPALTGIIDAALNARDCSAQTLARAAELVMRMAPQHIDFSARELTRLSEKSGNAPHVDLEGRLTDAQMAPLTPHILPLIKTWLARSQSYAIFSFLRSFGKRLRAAPQLLDQLVKMTADTRRDVATSALDLLVSTHVRDITDDLIPRLLKADPGWILTNAVSTHLNARRQDLLTEFLEPRVYSGRFSTYKTAFLPAFNSGFDRWTEKQQNRYADSLFSIARSAKRSVWELRGAVSTLADMPAADASKIERLAALDNKDSFLRDVALTALGRLDGWRGLPVLTAALDDERARIAIYALRRTLLDMPADAALEILRCAPLKQVTVAKEVVRLAGDIEGDAARRLLSEFVLNENLHRDTRIATMRALWNYLDDDETWDVLQRAAQSDQATARSTIRIPQDRLSPPARRRLAGHLTLLLKHESSQVRLETLQRLVSMPVALDRGSPLLTVLRELLAQPTDAEIANAAAALTLCTPAEDALALGETFAAAPTPRALLSIVGALTAQSRSRPARITPVAQTLVDRLVDARRHVGLATRLAFAALPASALETTIRRLADSKSLHAGALMEALAVLPTVANLRRAADLDQLEPRLCAMDDPAVRRIGLGILSARSATQGWSAAARERLALYRADRAALVSEAADLIFPPEDAVA